MNAHSEDTLVKKKKPRRRFNKTGFPNLCKKKPATKASGKQDKNDKAKKGRPTAERLSARDKLAVPARDRPERERPSRVRPEAVPVKGRGQILAKDSVKHERGKKRNADVVIVSDDSSDDDILPEMPWKESVPSVPKSKVYSIALSQNQGPAPSTAYGSLPRKKRRTVNRTGFPKAKKKKTSGKSTPANTDDEVASVSSRDERNQNSSARQAPVVPHVPKPKSNGPHIVNRQNQNRPHPPRFQHSPTSRFTPPSPRQTTPQPSSASIRQQPGTGGRGVVKKKRRVNKTGFPNPKRKPKKRKGDDGESTSVGTPSSAAATPNHDPDDDSEDDQRSSADRQMPHSDRQPRTPGEMPLVAAGSPESAESASAMPGVTSVGRHSTRTRGRKHGVHNPGGLKFFIFFWCCDHCFFRT